MRDLSRSVDDVTAKPKISQAENPFDWPLFGLQDDVRPALAGALASGAPAVLATLYAVVGGAPRGVGAQMLFAQGEIVGFLSGGCIEADVALHADQVMRDGAPQRIVYGEGGPADIQLPCGSRIDVLLEKIAPGDRAAMRLLDLTARRKPALWATNGAMRACVAVDAGEDAVQPALRPAADFAKGGNACGHVEQPFSLFRRYAPPLRLIVVGGDPIALAVTRLGSEMGLETTLIRPKGPETPPPERVRYIRSDIEAALATVDPDPWTAVAVLSHEADQEHAALKAALATRAGYVGALGSRRRIPERNGRLQASGVAADEIARVHAPIGLAIGGKSPWEIAVAIIAEVVAEMDVASTS